MRDTSLQRLQPDKLAWVIQLETFFAMNRFVLFLSVAAFATTSVAQTPVAKPATSAKPASAPTAAKPATAAAAPSAAEAEPWIKLPAGVPRVVHGPVKISFALRYEDIKVGTGAAGESGKLWHLKYTGWRAADGIEFDSWEDHLQPVIGSDGKLELGADGKPKFGDPKPIEIPQGVGRVIPGFDYGLEGMKIGGKRRIFIPWQMAYATHAMPDRPDRPGTRARPGIPAKSDLIFDVELVDVTEMPAQPPQISRPGGMPGNHPPITVPVHPGGPPTPAPTGSAPPATTTPAPATQPAQPAAPAQTTPPTAPSGVQAQPK
jgi:peptidylprolyl isomerase